MERKRQIAASFSAAAATYDSAAEAQARAADRLAELVRAEGLTRPRVLEFGCGTGLFTRRLLGAVGDAEVLATDLSPTMAATAAAMPDPRLRFGVMDAERPDAAAGSFDLIVSNLAAQWFADLPAALARLAECLAPGGRLMLSTLGEGSFAEWRLAHRAQGVASGVPAYPDAAALAGMFPAGGRIITRSEPFTVSYADARAFVRALKAIGAATPRPGHRPLPAGTLRRIMASLGAPCTVTYDVVYATFTRERAKP
jgi:malonyl-CoA O-methyltransferase